MERVPSFELTLGEAIQLDGILSVFLKDQEAKKRAGYETNETYIKYAKAIMNKLESNEREGD